MKRLLVIGATGLVGSKVLEAAGRYGYEGHGTYNARKSPLPRSHQLDITDLESTKTLVEDLRPVAIVNTAALHNVDYCETHRAEADKVNVQGVKNLSEAASRTNCRLVHLSTDYVFDGEKGHYKESDHPRPISYYAKTKLESELATSVGTSFAIARPSVIYGWNKLERDGIPSSSGKTINFAMYVLDKLAKGESVRAVKDQFSSPTLADNLAEAILKLVEYRGNGLFHTAGRSCLSRYDFALEIAKAFGYPTNQVQPVSSSEFKQVAPRPKNSCLSSDKAEKKLGMRFLTAAEGVRKMKTQALSIDSVG